MPISWATMPSPELWLLLCSQTWFIECLWCALLQVKWNFLRWSVNSDSQIFWDYILNDAAMYTHIPICIYWFTLGCNDLVRTIQHTQHTIFSIENEMRDFWKSIFASRIIDTHTKNDEKFHQRTMFSVQHPHIRFWMIIFILLSCTTYRKC